ncbi:hypothetical protein, partial [Arcanobacterium phocae]|uniref:hypothetical protein n=1 Tax=Arcanobacterium phocae TaxID=131112 RepID=UPI001C115744
MLMSVGSREFLVLVHDRAGDHVHRQGDDEEHETGSDQLVQAHVERLGEVERDLRRDRLVPAGLHERPGEDAAGEHHGDRHG